MKIKINLRNGSTLDFEVPDGTHFQAMCCHVKAAGYFMSDAIFIPYEFIGSMHVDGPSVVQKVVMSGPETKQ